MLVPFRKLKTRFIDRELHNKEIENKSLYQRQFEEDNPIPSPAGSDFKKDEQICFDAVVMGLLTLCKLKEPGLTSSPLSVSKVFLLTF